MAEEKKLTVEEVTQEILNHTNSNLETVSDCNDYIRQLLKQYTQEILGHSYTADIDYKYTDVVTESNILMVAKNYGVELDNE